MSVQLRIIGRNSLKINFTELFFGISEILVLLNNHEQDFQKPVY